MTDFKEFSTSEMGESWGDRLRWLRLRALNRFALAREGYTESCQEPTIDRWIESQPEASAEEIKRLESIFRTRPWSSFLSLIHYRQNLSTLRILESCYASLKLENSSAWNSYRQRNFLPIAELGAHTFSRAPAIMRFMERFCSRPLLAGYELSPFPSPLQMHSVFDIARHICRNVPRTRFAQADMQDLRMQQELILFFYPFVSKDPTQAWGLPSYFGSADALIRVLERNLKPGGYAVLVHQGDWESDIFAESLQAMKSPLLEQVKISEYQCPILPTQYPAELRVLQKN